MPEPTAANPRAVIRQWIDQAAMTGNEDVYASKREHPRFSWHVPFELSVGETVLYVHARDICEYGLGIVCKRSLVTGETVFVRQNPDEPWIRCRVVHTTQTVGSFKVGVELEFDFDDDQ